MLQTSGWFQWLRHEKYFFSLLTLKFFLDLLVVWISWKVVFYLSFEGCYFQNLVDLKAFQIQAFGWSLCILLEKYFFNISFCKIQKPCFSLDGALNKLKGHFLHVFKGVSIFRASSSKTISSADLKFVPMALAQKILFNCLSF